MQSETISTVERLLLVIYGDQGSELLPQLVERIEHYRQQLAIAANPGSRWSERDTALITYGDQVSDPSPDVATLESFRQFVVDEHLDDAFSIVHVLPFCPYSSDDGFSVIDFRAVDERLGAWDDLQRLGEHVDLMYDLVLNHISQHSEWFQGFLRGDARYQNWFHAVDPSLDLSQVTRPRSHPLLTPFDTGQGERHIWTTFSDDQIDLNYAEPTLLLEMLDILLLYVARGARVIRLDAIAFLWKKIGTTCLHLEQTHAVVKLFRAVLDEVAPQAILLTETNVPHEENTSYFGAGDEAHMVYNFSLPPLLYDAYVNQDAVPLVSWMRELKAPPANATWFNFTASHDGIGVRPLEGLVDQQRFDRLVTATRERGGEVSMRTMPNGDLRPYELNITWRDAMRRPEGDDPWLVQRMLASQAFMLAFQGLPATYFHAVVGTPNDTQGMRESGHPRRINRRKFERGELDEMVREDPVSSRVFQQYRRMLQIRRAQPAFHPDGDQSMLDAGDNALAAFRRTCPQGKRTITVVANFSDEQKELPAGCDPSAIDLLTGSPVATLEPCQLVWLAQPDENDRNQ